MADRQHTYYVQTGHVNIDQTLTITIITPNSASFTVNLAELIYFQFNKSFHFNFCSND